VYRILLALSDAFRRRATDLQRTLDAATELDVLQARGRFSLAVDGVMPAIASDGRLELRAARHPLLIETLRRHLGEEVSAAAPSAPVPVDVLLIPPVHVLVVTGPNTGGKTVALKTAGLLSLMAQAGLLIPAAEGSQIPVFRTVFAGSVLRNSGCRSVNCSVPSSSRAANPLISIWSGAAFMSALMPSCQRSWSCMDGSPRSVLASPGARGGRVECSRVVVGRMVLP